MNEKTITNVIYDDQIQIGGLTIQASGEGGALSILASENSGVLTENIILVSLNNTPKQLTYLEFSVGFPSKTVDNNRANSVFYAIGHVINQGKNQSRVIEYCNTVRSIQKTRNADGTCRNTPLQKRTADITHNSSQIFIQH